MRLSLEGKTYEVQNVISKIAYVAFIVFGGVFIEPEVDKKIKFLFISLTSWTVAVGAGGPLLYLFLHRHDDMSVTTTIFINLTINGVLALNTGQVIFFIYRKQIKSSIKSMDSNFDTGLSDVVGPRGSQDIMNVKKLILVMLSAGLWGTVSYLAIRPIGLMILGKENMDNIFYQLSPLPLDFAKDKLGTVCTYWLNYFMIALTAFHILPAAIVSLLIVTVIPSVLYNNFVYLSNLIDIESSKNLKYYEEGLADESNNWQPYRYIDCYGKLMREVENAREYIQMIYSFVFIGTFSASVPTGVLIITSESIPIYTLLSTACLVLTCVGYIGIFSYIGSLYEEINTKLMLDIYNIPWYYMAPKQRRDLILFMSMLQKPIVFKIVKLRPVAMNLLLRFFQLNYTILNFIRMQSM